MLLNRTKSVFKWRYLLFMSILLFGCAAEKGMYLKLTTEHYPALKVKDLTLFSKDSTFSLNGLNLDVKGKIKWADFDSSGKYVLANYDPWDSPQGKGLVTICFDLEQKKIIWGSRSNPYYGFIYPDFYELKFTDGTKLISRKNGMLLAEFPSNATVLPKRKIWIQKQKDSKGTSQYLAKSLIGGKVLWRANMTGGGEWFAFEGNKKYSVGPSLQKGQEGFAWFAFEGNKKYSVGDDGLYCLDYSNGKTWSVKASTTATEGELKAAVLSVISLTLAAMGGGYGAVRGPDHISGLSSAPFIFKDRVYFVAKNEILCADKEKGTLIWKTQLKANPSRAVIGAVDSTLLVIYNGWRMKNSALTSAGGSAIFMIRTQDGKMLYMYESDKNNPIVDYISTPTSIYLMSMENLFVLDKKLRLISQISSKKYGRFLKLIKNDKSGIFLRTTDGVLSFSESPLHLKWWKKLNTMKIDRKNNPWLIGNAMSGKRYVLIDGNIVDVYTSWKKLFDALFANTYLTNYYTVNNYLWLQNSDRFSCINAEDGNYVIQLYIPKEVSYSITSDGKLRYYTGKRIAQISLHLNTKKAR